MTSPNREVVANSYGVNTVTQMQGLTQKDIGQRQGAEVQNMLDDVGFSFIDVILGGFGNVFGAIGSAIEKFIGDLVRGLKGVTGGLIDLTGFLKQTDTKANNAQTVAQEAKDKATDADVAAGNAAVIAANADSKAIQANNAAAAAAELAAQAAGGQDASNMAYVYNSEKETMRTTYPASAPFAFVNSPTIAVSGEWVVRLQPPNPTTVGYPTHDLGPQFLCTPGEKIYMEWRQRRAGASFLARLNLHVYDNAGNTIAYDLFPITPPANAADNTWITYAGIVTLPAGAARAVPQLKMIHPEGTNVSGIIYFEEMVVRRAITAAQVATSDGTTLDTKLVTLTENNSVTNQLAVQAANEAQEALITADIAYENAQYWKDECVVASAGIGLGVNELVIGVVMDVPTGRTRKITDMHFAFQSKPNQMVIETRVQNSNGVGDRLVHTDTIPALNTRYNINNLAIDVADKERVFWYVTDLGGTAQASVLQVALVGVLL